MQRNGAIRKLTHNGFGSQTNAYYSPSNSDAIAVTIIYNDISTIDPIDKSTGKPIPSNPLAEMMNVNCQSTKYELTFKELFRGPVYIKDLDLLIYLEQHCHAAEFPKNYTDDDIIHTPLGELKRDNNNLIRVLANDPTGKIKTIYVALSEKCVCPISVTANNISDKTFRIVKQVNVSEEAVNKYDVTMRASLESALNDRYIEDSDDIKYFVAMTPQAALSKYDIYHQQERMQYVRVDEIEERIDTAVDARLKTKLDQCNREHKKEMDEINQLAANEVKRLHEKNVRDVDDIDRKYKYDLETARRDVTDLQEKLNNEIDKNNKLTLELNTARTQISKQLIEANEAISKIELLKQERDSKLKALEIDKNNKINSLEDNLKARDERIVKLESDLKRIEDRDKTVKEVLSLKEDGKTREFKEKQHETAVKVNSTKASTENWKLGAGILTTLVAAVTGSYALWTKVLSKGLTASLTPSTALSILTSGISGIAGSVAAGVKTVATASVGLVSAACSKVKDVVSSVWDTACDLCDTCFGWLF
jgi:hypothetical protein